MREKSVSSHESKSSSPTSERYKKQVKPSLPHIEKRVTVHKQPERGREAEINLKKKKDSRASSKTSSNSKIKQKQSSADAKQQNSSRGRKMPSVPTNKTKAKGSVVKECR